MDKRGMHLGLLPWSSVVLEDTPWVSAMCNIQTCVVASVVRDNGNVIYLSQSMMR